MTKAEKHLITLEKRAATLKAKAKSFTDIGKANALAANARLLRQTLTANGILKSL